MNQGTNIGSSIDLDEVERFGALATQWWDARGPFAPLHRFNPVRLAFIRKQCLRHFGRDGQARAPFAGLKLIDVGCGGGLLCEPMARLGFDVTGIDAAPRNVAAATEHARRSGLEVTYRATTAEAVLGADGAVFDVVLNMEVVEHVADPAAFLRDCASLLAPGGLMILATLNRTAKAFALGKIVAEHLLRWVPVGTHDWRRFVTPEEIRAFLAHDGLVIAGPFGVAYDVLSGCWRQSPRADVNYMMTIARPSLGITAAANQEDPGR